MSRNAAALTITADTITGITAAAGIIATVGTAATAAPACAVATAVTIAASCAHGTFATAVAEARISRIT